MNTRNWKPLKKRTVDQDDLFGRALEAFKTADSAAPGWDETKRLILNSQQREQKMIPNDKTATSAWTRKPALVSAFSFIILIAFFAVPFSQTAEIGAHLVFELAEPGTGTQELDFSTILDDPAYGIDNWNTSITLDSAEGPLVIDLLLLTEDLGAPGAALAALTAEYPVLAGAETTITPVTESSSATIFHRLTGEMEVRITCEGMSAAEIEEMIRQSLAEQGAGDVDVQVTESADGEQRQITISVTGDQETDQ